ncbi:DNA topoisomerase VI subunit A [Nanobdella aerobiophila]|uniref:Type 2 DNA topoisomerase 6 subunit A n=1 Tax=Nanobdella aerobiophila TaxID=2586965 RepID=A0A915WSU3_9ARCH|nr:DNA topoisomerase IV subunit A [Nanobdella aerobiophila]BBL45567.1 DNA topoisomerase VI subunit A [Nanobdella aerobiophila]
MTGKFIENISPKEVINRIKELGDNILKGFNDGNPIISFALRGNIKNIEYDEKYDIIKLKEKVGTREFFNLGHVRRFTQTLLVAGLAKKLVERDKTASLREVYYQLKHTIPMLNLNTFEKQEESDAVIEDLERAIKAIREQFHIKAEGRGAIYGDIILKDRKRNDEWNCAKLGRGGWSVPSTIEDVEIGDINADYVLVVEKEAMFDRLIEERFPEKNKAILITGKGQPPRGIRRLVHRLRYEKNMPVYVFTDGDPAGYYIYSVIKRGSMNLSQFSELLATPDAKYIGMTMDDVENYNLLKKGAVVGLEEWDIKRLNELQNYPWFKKSKDWQRQFKKMLSLKIKVEQDALAANSLEFVADTYLPEKISKPEKMLN